MIAVNRILLQPLLWQCTYSIILWIVRYGHHKCLFVTELNKVSP